MNKANECTCPSGNGSLVHPCPTHPAVEQAGGDERAAFELFVRKHCGMPAHIAVNWDAKFTNDAWEGWKARAALAQPSPDAPYADDIAADLERSDWTPEDALRWYAAGKHFDTVNGRTRIIDTGAVASNALKHLSLPYLEMKGDAELTELREAMAQPSPAQAEAERPEVVAYRTIGRHEKHQHPHYALNYYKQNAEDQAAHWRERGCEVSEDELMTVAQHERIVGELRAVIAQLRQHKNDYMDSGQETYRALQNEIREREAEIARLDGLVSGRTAERDAALARVAELERQEPVALANRGLHAFWVKWTEAAAGLIERMLEYATRPAGDVPQAEQAEAERPEGPTEDELEAAGLGYPLHKEEAVKLWYSGFRSEVITVLEAWEAIGHDIGMNPDKGELLDSLRYMLEKCEAHDAALAEVAGLRSLLNSLLCYVERDIDRMRSDRDKSDNKEIYDRSISLAMERLKAAQNAVFTTEPGCDTAVELAAQTTQAQHCVPELLVRAEDFVSGKEVPQAWLDVQAERRRQITAEGWTPEHDDLYCAAELPRAAAAYILNGANDEAPAIWPFSAKWWKPRDARSNYVRAGALILAEIERLDRAAHGKEVGHE
ncbi:TPA: hypothetical protein ACQ491_000349 [Pseudomonas aeruginosa]|uniref:Uncharacterized protein n=1 Tax=Siphoviridae sp. ctnLs3 TaxID=2827937 RepID=A0A8S5TDS5_9CAUD|nr:hypothetical protein [Pseudomonas aeruginosa]DAF61187.1 MAG TPA: hypothetical protein [Siphoviridae sp. ctnLs3]MCW0966333.1 hypothetical protein [Pseudomonas aeruginosa]MDU3443758.1 hypothetical protein [Pseudomonas aeruginosa]MDU3952515.1 hypothetical protein [Pseudomonas aeruginosa]UNK85868.1 hypothetical protein MN130_07360 [Pseudomonas aeruginosa]